MDKKTKKRFILESNIVYLFIGLFKIFKINDQLSGWFVKPEYMWRYADVGVYISMHTRRFAKGQKKIKTITKFKMYTNVWNLFSNFGIMYLYLLCLCHIKCIWVGEVIFYKVFSS